MAQDFINPAFTPAQEAEIGGIFPVRTIGPFQAQITTDETATDRSVITRHPVEGGAAITDHTYPEPAALTLNVLFTEDQGDLPTIYEDVLNLRNSGIPFNVVTGKRLYRNMLIEQIVNITDTRYENALLLTLDVVEIIITQLETVLLPPRENQFDPLRTGSTEKAGRKNPKEPTAAQQSALSAIFG